MSRSVTRSNEYRRLGFVRQYIPQKPAEILPPATRRWMCQNCHRTWKAHDYSRLPCPHCHRGRVMEIH